MYFVVFSSYVRNCKKDILAEIQKVPGINNNQKLYLYLNVFKIIPIM